MAHIGLDIHSLSLLSAPVSLAEGVHLGGVLKMRGTLLGVPVIIKVCCILGSMLGSPYSGKLPLLPCEMRALLD